MRVLVTGMTGFMAGRFFRYLAQNEPDVHVYGFDKAYGENLEDAASVDKAVEQVDAVFHFGALTHIDSSIVHPEPFFPTNVMGTLHVLQSCTKHRKKLVQISSSEIYGSLSQEEFDAGKLQGEDYRLNPQSPYAASKVAQDVMCTAWHHTYETDVRVLRPFNQWGPGQDIRKMIPKFFYQVSQGLPITAHGDGQSTRDWVWVDDFVEAVWKSINLPEGTVANVATGRAYSVVQVVDMIKELVGNKESQVVFVNHTDQRWGYVKHLRGDGSYLESLTGWKPKITLESGLPLLYQWLKTNGPVFYRGGEGWSEPKTSLAPVTSGWSPLGKV